MDVSFTDSRNSTITQRFLGCIESLAEMEDHTCIVGTHMKVMGVEDDLTLT